MVNLGLFFKYNLFMSPHTIASMAMPSVHCRGMLAFDCQQTSVHQTACFWPLQYMHLYLWALK